MTGIEILNSFQVPIGYDFNWVTAGIVFSFFLMLGVWGFEPCQKRWWGILICCLLVGTFYAIVFGVALQTPNEFKTHYEVLLSDEIPLTEFLEDYEIVEQEGKIYTIRERTETDG